MKKLTRREFLKASAAAGAMLPLACVMAENNDAPAPAATGLLRRKLGKTGVPVTILGLGCAYIAGENINTRGIVETALDGGVRYFDTAPNYKGSEEALGPLLADVRDEVFLVTKLDHTGAKEAEMDLQESLKRLKTDRVDLLLLHGVGLSGDWQDAERICAEAGALTYLRKAKRDGLTRFIGMSVHQPHSHALHVLKEAEDLDVVMPFVNHMAIAKDTDDIIAPCHKMGMGIVAMKVLGGGGQLAKDYDRSFRYPLSVPGVACAPVGVKSPEEVRRAVRAAKEFRPLTPDEMKEATKAGAALIRDRSVEYAQFRSHFGWDAGSA
ncbi:MAG: aldo/keto reductase [Planctomycetes bacterium]|nr:aldo/keto reductase [Planctomycetota bacterium]